MVFFNYASMEMSAKIVFYGPGLCGKTTNLKWIFNQIPEQRKGEMISLATETDRTLFFDLLPLKLGKVGDFTTRIQLYTVPGQVFYNSTRKLVLKGVDGIVFVADSQEPMLDANIESLENLQENLEEQKLNLNKLPWVIQYNKRDLPGIMPVSVLNRHLNFMDVPYYEAIATKGDGVMDTLVGISSLTLRYLKRKAGEIISDDDEQLQQVREELLRSFEMGEKVAEEPEPTETSKEPVMVAPENLGNIESHDDVSVDSVEVEPLIDTQDEPGEDVKDVEPREEISVKIAPPPLVTVDVQPPFRGEGQVIDKDVVHKLRVPIKIIKSEDVAHVNVNLKLEIECVLQTETVKKQESKAEKLASQALEDFLLGRTKKR